jgi:hypothetical protein
MATTAAYGGRVSSVRKAAFILVLAEDQDKVEITNVL